ncbi:MAG: hypothetical protein LUD16_00220 [Lachnospiraceae bacterium]|nr:hypothetical protein [Lachnospiraceae bacterium]
MKKKLVAIMLGLTLSFTSVGVFAEEAETETETETETENAAISAGIALLDAAAGTGLDLYGEIVIINDDGTLVVNTGDLIEDEEDAASATLELSEVYIQFTVADDVTSAQLADLLTITTVEANADEDAEEETENTEDEDAEEAETADSDEDAEGTADEDAVEDTEAESETEETVETEDFDVSDFQVGDIIHFTISSSFEIDTVTLIYTQADEAEDEETATEAGMENEEAAETETETVDAEE